MELRNWLRVLRRVLDQNTTLVLATTGDEGPWSARAYFAEHEGDLYLALEPARTLNNIRKNPRVSFTIDRGVPDQFAQGEGEAEELGSIHERKERVHLFRRTLEVVGFARSMPDLRIVRIRPKFWNIWDLTGTWKPRARLAVDQKFLDLWRKEFQRRVPRWRVYWKAVRPFSFTATTIAVLLGSILAPNFSLKWFLITLLAGLLVHAGVNAISDFFDYQKGVDNYLTLGSSRVLVDEEMRPSEVLALGVALLVLGAAIGLWLCAVRGWTLLWIGLAGYGLGIFYTAAPVGLKYRALGDLAVFLAFGPLMTLGAYFVQTQTLAGQPALLAVPVGLLVVGILHGNNLRDIEADQQAGYRTLAGILGRKAGGYYYGLLVLGAYALVLALVLLRLLPPHSLLVFLTLPVALQNVRIALEPARVAYGLLDLLTAQLHFRFGVFFVLGLLLSRLRILWQ